jgi:hypothetical protein
MTDNTTSESVETPVEAVETTSTETVETVETPQSSEDIWNTPLNLTAETEAEASTEDTETKTEETPAAPEVNESAEEANEETETEDESETLEASADKPAPLSRRKLREVEDKLITPLRDPDANINDVWQGLYDLNPARAEQLATSIAQASAQSYPDLWLQTILGDPNVTVDSIKQQLSGIEPTQASDAMLDAVKHLDEMYEGWRDPSRDGELLDEDKVYVQAIRDQLSTKESVQTEKDAEIAKLKEELNSIKPEIDSIKTRQQQEYEARVQQAIDTAANEYRDNIDKRAVEPTFAELGLKVSESDTPSVKGTKEYIQSQFKSVDGFMSPFDQFTVSKFSDKDAITQIVGRVEKFLTEAQTAEVKASQAKGEKATELKKLADARRADAESEKARLVTLRKKAAREFAQTIPLMSILEENADLQRRLALRQEVVGTSSVAANTQSWKEALNEDPWSDKVSIADRAQSYSR